MSIGESSLARTACRPSGSRTPRRGFPGRIGWPPGRGNFEPIPRLYVQLVRTLAAVEPVHVLAGGHPMAQARVLLAGMPNVTLHDIPTDDAWIRDSGPTFLVGPPGSPPALGRLGLQRLGRQISALSNTTTCSAG